MLHGRKQVWAVRRKRRKEGGGEGEGKEWGNGNGKRIRKDRGVCKEGRPRMEGIERHLEMKLQNKSSHAMLLLIVALTSLQAHPSQS